MNNKNDQEKLLSRIEKRLGTREESQILEKLDKLITSVRLIPDLQHTVMSILDIVKANPLITYGKFKILRTILM